MIIGFPSGDGYSRMFEPVVDDDIDDGDGLEAARAFMANPARLHILGYLKYAADLGFDRDDPDIEARATVAGERAYERAQGLPFGDPRRHEPIVYYMQMGDLVKIGTSVNIVSRVGALHPERLLAVEMGGYQIESQRHRQFAADHNHGEWFRITPALALHMSRTRAAFEALVGLTLDAWLAERSQPMRQRTSSASTPTRSPDGPEPEDLSRSVGSALGGRP